MLIAAEPPAIRVIALLDAVTVSGRPLLILVPILWVPVIAIIRRYAQRWGAASLNEIFQETAPYFFAAQII